MNIKNFAPFALLFLVTACQTTDTPTPVVDVSDTSSSEMSQIVDSSESSVMDDSDDSQYIRYLGKSTLIDHEGSFEEFTVTYEPGATEEFSDGVITVEIATASITSDSEGLTGHLNKEDFFDTEVYPTATFVSTNIVTENEAESQYSITGDLTIKGITNEVTGTGVYQDGVLLVEFMVPRREFNVGNDNYGEKLLDAEVPVTAKIIIE